MAKGGGGIETRAMSIVWLVVGALVVVTVLASLVDDFFGSADAGTGLAALIDNLTVVELGTSTAATIAETIISTLAIVVAIAGAFVLINLALKAFKQRS